MVIFADNNSRRTINFNPCMVPKYASVDLLSITTPLSDAS
jgi:hypothetical protein